LLSQAGSSNFLCLSCPPAYYLSDLIYSNSYNFNIFLLCYVGMQNWEAIVDFGTINSVEIEGSDWRLENVV
jgi:hypothetical protein